MKKRFDDKIGEKMSEHNYKITVKLLKENATVEYIKDVTGMTIEQILKVQNRT